MLTVARWPRLQDRMCSYKHVRKAYAFLILPIVACTIMACTSDPEIVEIDNWVVIKQPDFVSDAMLYTLRNVDLVFSHDDEASLETWCWSYDTELMAMTISWREPSDPVLEPGAVGRGSYHIGDSTGNLSYVFAASGQARSLDIRPPSNTHSTVKLVENGLWSDMLANENHILSISVEIEPEQVLSAQFALEGLTDALAQTPCHIAEKWTTS